MGKGFGNVGTPGEDRLRALLLQNWNKLGRGEGVFLFKQRRAEHLASVIDWFNREYPEFEASFHPGDKDAAGFCGIKVLRRNRGAES